VLSLADGLRLYGRPAPGLPAATPLLILEGEDDSLGGRRSAERLAEAYRSRSGLADVTLHVYPDARHEVFAELNKDEVIGDLIGWLDERLALTSSRAS
jgi:alpha-beta hydrolase superfamily lysophospholipase